MSGVRCKALSTTTGEPCRKWAMHGQQVCRSHGGASPQARRKAQERIAEAQLKREALRKRPQIHNPIQTPIEVLERELDFWDQRVRTLDDEIRSAGPPELIRLLPQRDDASRNCVAIAKDLAKFADDGTIVRWAGKQHATLVVCVQVAVERILVDLFRRSPDRIRQEIRDYAAACLAFGLRLSEDPHARAPAPPKFPKVPKRIERHLDPEPVVRSVVSRPTPVADIVPPPDLTVVGKVVGDDYEDQDEIDEKALRRARVIAANQGSRTARRRHKEVK